MAKQVTVNIFRSKDLYLSAFLLSKKVKLISTQRENGKVFFCFEQDPNINRFIREFTNGEISGFIREIYNVKMLLNTT